MKLRQKPEDFIVEEVNNFTISDKGEYKLFLLEKKNKEAFELIDYLSRINKIPYDAFGIAGLKDRHAITRQYFTLKNIYELKTYREESYNIEFIGFVDKPIKIGDLIGNKFKLTVRDIAKGEIEGVLNKSREIIVPNYYDSQRFRSVTKKEFVAKYLLRKDYENAVKLYLTSYSKSEPREVKEDKRTLLKYWGKPLNLKTKRLMDILNTYKNTKNWLKAYQRIPGNIRELLVAAYQSYLWNECIKKFISENINRKYLYTIDYSVGTLMFFKKLDKVLPEQFQTISDTIIPEKHEQKIIEKILAKEGFSVSDFKILESGNFFKTHKRNILLKPKNFNISKPIPDELNKNRYKFVVEFELPKGSYATIIIKRLFNK